MASKDFSRTKNNGQSTSDIAVLERNKPGKAKDIAKYGVITIEKDKSVYDAIRKLVEKNISGLPVVDDTGLVGIISEKDVLRLLYDKKLLRGSVGDYMTGDVVSFDEEDNLANICDCLVNNHFRRVPILHRGKLVGILSRADLIKANKTTKTVNRIYSPRVLYRCIKSGFYVGDQHTLLYYPFPSSEEMEKKHHRWWRWAQES